MTEPREAGVAAGGGLRATVDARTLRSAGIGRYLREILQRLLVDPRFARVTLLGDRAEIAEFLDGVGPTAAGVEVVDHVAAMYSPGAQLGWVRLARSGRAAADVTFFPHYDAPMVAMPPRSLVTVHDLIHFKVPEAFPASKRIFGSMMLRRVVQQAARVLTESESTRRDLVERLPGTAPKLGVIPLGVSDFFLEDEGASAGRPVEGPYLLCVGNRKPHKNLSAAIEALGLLRTEMPELRVVLAGRAYPGWDGMLRRAEALDVRDRILDFDEVDDDLLRQLYRHCEALVFPSLYEGFGLPVLEAMACGAPVVATTRSSVPEVVGDAGILVDPADHAGIADAVRRIRNEPGLRADLSARGRARARDFSWERAARSTVDELHATGVGSRVGPAAAEVGARRAAVGATGR